MASELASRGFTAITSRLFAEKYGSWTADVGRNYLLPTSIQWKRFSCCAWSHAALLAVERLRNLRSDLANGICEIVVESYSDAVNQLGVGIPDNSEQAQFSMSWPVAVMLLDGEVHPRSMLSGRIAEQHTRDLAAKVAVHENAALTRLYLLCESNDPSGREAANVRVKLEDGSVLDSGVVAFDPYEQLPSSRQVIEEKFRWATSDALASDDAEAVIQASRDLSAMQNIRELTNILGRRQLPTSPTQNSPAHA
jgi:2-methylcitrate dehydratase PrpD